MKVLSTFFSGLQACSINRVNLDDFPEISDGFVSSRLSPELLRVPQQPCVENTKRGGKFSADLADSRSLDVDLYNPVHLQH